MVYSEDKLCRPSNFDCVQQYSAIASLYERGITAGRKWTVSRPVPEIGMKVQYSSACIHTYRPAHRSEMLRLGNSSSEIIHQCFFLSVVDSIQVITPTSKSGDSKLCSLRSVEKRIHIIRRNEILEDYWYEQNYTITHSS